MYRLSGLEEAIRNDLRGAISDHLDAQMLTGNGTAPNVAGDHFCRLTATPGTDPADTDDFTEIMIRFLELVDGKFATMASELQLVMSCGHVCPCDHTIPGRLYQHQRLRAAYV